MKEIQTSDGQIIMVDDEDYPRLSKHIWHVNQYGYAFRFVYLGKSGNKRRKLLMHTGLLKVSNKRNIVDHRDRNRLNNTKDNLREITRAQNARNRRKYKGRSIYKGVSPTPEGKFRAQIGFNHKHIHIGIFDYEIHAALAFDFWARKLDPEHFNTNFDENHPDYEIVIEMLDEEGYYSPVKNPLQKNCDYRGVKYLKDKDAYGAFIGYKGQRFKLGTRKEMKEAAILYDSAARIIMGDKARLNFPEVDPIPHVVERAQQIMEEMGAKEEPTTNKIIPDREKDINPSYRGVNINGSKYSAQIYYKGKRIHIGTFDTPELAALEYNKKALEFHGSKAKLNDV